MPSNAILVAVLPIVKGCDGFHAGFGTRYGWQGHAWDNEMTRRLNELLDSVDAEQSAT